MTAVITIYVLSLVTPMQQIISRITLPVGG